MTSLVMFLDDGGVMNDNQVRAPQWQRLVGAFFAPRLGGTIVSWGEANRIVSERLFDPDAWLARMRAAPDYATVDRGYWRDWLGGMCAIMGVSAPPEAEGLELARRASAFVTRRIRAAFPGAVDAIRMLHARNYTLHTAPANPQATSLGTLRGCGCARVLAGSTART